MGMSRMSWSRRGNRLLVERLGSSYPQGDGTATAEWSGPFAPAKPRSSYDPTVLQFGFLVLGIGLLEVGPGAFEWPRAMARFMGGFFLAFAYFKLLDLRVFADAYASYDVVAAHWRWDGSRTRSSSCCSGRPTCLGSRQSSRARSLWR